MTHGQFFAVILILSAGALAAWFVARFPRLAPRELRPAMLHVGGSLLIAYVAVPLLKPYVHALDEPFSTQLIVLGMLLPALVYRFVSTIWVMRVVLGAVRPR